MRKYTFEIEETFARVVEIDADNAEDANRKIRDRYYNTKDFVLSAEDFYQTNFYLLSESEEQQEKDLFVYIYKVMDNDEYFETKLFLGTEEKYKEFASKSKFAFAQFTDFGKAPDEIVMFNNGEWELLPRDVAYKHLPTYVAENDILWSNK